MSMVPFSLLLLPSMFSLAVPEKKIFYLVTLILHEIWKIKGKKSPKVYGANWLCSS